MDAYHELFVKNGNVFSYFHEDFASTPTESVSKTKDNTKDTLEIMLPKYQLEKLGGNLEQEGDTFIVSYKSFC